MEPDLKKENQENATPGLDNITEPVSAKKENPKNNISVAEKQDSTLKFDGTFDIATGKNRKETHWRNRETTWGAFLNKIKKTHRTAETQAEYNASKKTRQDEIKDVGGFVGGYVNNGRRKAENITHRQLITLDIDFAEADIWEDVTMQYGCAAAIYSTHKHSPDNPRYRLIIPLDRTVRTDEYVAIARKVADAININAFDDTTFEPSRLMYWPSTSKDGEYVFHYQDGPWLSADEVLRTYRNWKDASEWPISDRVNKVINHEIKKQGDPLEKPGIVGAFCRTYENIHEVIETILSDVYESCDMDNRYTYKEGSTAAGLVVYDDKFTYSHHGTDPTSGRTCNAFDLVRLHLFGLQDEDAKEGTPVNKLPSYLAMCDYARNDKKVKQQIGKEKLESVREDFADVMGEDEGEPDTEWMKDLVVERKGNPKSTVHNVELIINNDPNLKKRFAKNLFENREVILRDLPWRKYDPKNPYMKDADDAGVRGYLEAVYGITGVQKITDGLRLAIEANAFHPVRDYLESLKWDGTPRVETVTIDYLGVKDDKYIRHTTRKALAAAVTRIFNPGCKWDYVLTAVGKQGQGKSKLFDKLAKQWFSDSFNTVNGKEAYEQIQGVWIVEMAELSGVRKADIEAVKNFITKREDRFRVAYGRRVENFPRQCIFFATTNERDFLRDASGNRRFWPQDTFETLPKKDIDKDLTDSEIDQIWAEAVELYKKGEPLYLDKEVEEMALQEQEGHCEMDERTLEVEKFLNTPVPENWEEWPVFEKVNYFLTPEMREKGTKLRQTVSVAEIWVEAFNRKLADITTGNTKDLHNIMKNMPGWEAAKASQARVKGYGRYKIYERVSEKPVMTDGVTGVTSVITKKEPSYDTLIN